MSTLWLRTPLLHAGALRDSHRLSLRFHCRILPKTDAFACGAAAMQAALGRGRALHPDAALPNHGLRR